MSPAPAARLVAKVALLFLLASCTQGLDASLLADTQLTTHKVADVSGVVLDLLTEAPVAGAQVLIADRADSSGPTGAFFVSEVRVGEQMLTIQASGYKPFDRAVALQPGANSVGRLMLVPTSCAPVCGDDECGPDGCGGSCGSCDAAESCAAGACVACAPSCGERDCGSDGCGGSCGSCGEGAACRVGACVACADGVCPGPPEAWTCEPSYFGAADGCDCGCGAYDPDCELPAQDLFGCTGMPAATCDAAGACACTPSCAGRACGNDGCGGSCGDCLDGDACGLDGQCACEPQCDGKACGPDGCGGSCGECGALSCLEGACACEGDGQCGALGRCDAGACACQSGALLCGGACAACPSDGVLESGCAAEACVATLCDVGLRPCETGCCAWTSEAAGRAGRDVALRIASDGVATLASLSTTSPTSVEVAVRGGSGFVAETAATLAASSAEGLDLALDAAGRPHVVYLDPLAAPKVMYAWRDGEAWVREPVAEITAGPPAVAPSDDRVAIALDADGVPHLAYAAYRSATTFELFWAHRTSGVWQSESLGTFAFEGTDVGIAVVGTTPHLLTYDDGHLRHAVRVGAAWSWQDASGLWWPDLGSLMRLSVAAGPDGSLHVVYAERGYGGFDGGFHSYLEYVRFVDGQWSYGATIDGDYGDLHAGQRNAIAVDAAGRAHLVYEYQDFETGYRETRYATLAAGADDSAWQIGIVSRELASSVSVATDAEGAPRLAVANGGGAVTYYR